ncbi:MAG: sulfate-transporting ATPase [Francisellaceae bacterium]|jgi:sulfate-transporting ATPase
MSQKFIYSMNRVGKVVPPKKHILKDISLSFYDGAKIGVLGVNGSGKSTLLRIMAGIDKDFIGEAAPRKGIKIGYLPQEPKLDLNKSVKENVEEGMSELKDILNKFDEISMKFCEPMSDDEMEKLLVEQGELQNKIDAVGGWELDRKIEIAADALRLPPWDADVSTLSGGELRRVALCKLLLSSPDILLLDEPTNHLDAESVAWLERFLQDFQGTVVAITHDRYFLDNVAEWILELDRGEGIPFKGNYTNWLEQKDQRIQEEGKKQTAYQKSLKDELEWVRQNAKGRQAKSKARLAKFDELSSVEFQQRNETHELYIPPGPRLGNKVFEISNITKGFGDKLLMDKFNVNIPPGSVIGIVGPNGAGKSTFLKMIMGNDQPDEGSISTGETVELAYVDQSRDSLDGKKTVWEEISDGLDVITVGSYTTPSRAYVGRFNFKGSDQQKYIKDLSGGERNRVHLAKLLRSGGNVLLLDEPTNDLDTETLRALEDALLSFPGCILIISHDRWFLDRIATHIISFEGDSNVVWFEGNYEAFAEDKKKRLGDDSLDPQRIKFRKLQH